MSEVDPVILRLMVERGQFLSDINNVSRVVDQRFGSMERDVQDLERQMRASLGGISDSLKGLAAAAGIGISVGQVASLADAYTRFTNSLKVAGLEGQELGKVQNDLYAIAQKYGSELESVGTLYSRIAANSKDLGLNQEQLLQLVSGTSAALKVSGQSAEEASGALLQLSQALGGSTIQAEEYNSLIDGARPLLQAVANGSDRFAGSVTKLTAAVKSGNVSTKEFVQAGLRGMPSLMADAEKAAFTLSGALTILNNALGKYIGEADQSLSASAKVSQGISYIAENLRIILPALATLATAIGVGYVAAAAKGAISSATLAAANTRAALTAEAMASATYQANVALLGERAAADLAAVSVSRLAVAQGAAAGAGNALLAAVGGPIGAAVLALGAGFAILSAREAAAQAAADDLSASIEGQTTKFEALRQKKAQAAAETNNLTKKQRDALTATANLTGEANLLANAWARVAAEAKNAAIEQAKAALVDAEKNRRLAQQAVNTQAEVERKRPSNQPSGSPQGTIGRGLSALFSAVGLTNPKQAAQREQKGREQLNAAIENETLAREELAKISNSSLATYRQAELGGGDDANSKALAKHQAVLADLEKLKAGASGKELATINTKIAREKAIIGNLQKGVGETAAIAAASGSAASHAKKKDRTEQELSRLAIEELQARLDLATNAQDRADLQNEILAEERKQRVAEINSDDQLSAAQKAAALARIAKLYGSSPTDSGDIPVTPGLLQQRINQDKEEQLAREALERAQAGARNDEDLLRAQADLAITRADRREIELKLLDLAYQQERAEQQAVLDSATASDAQREIAAERLRILDQLKGYDAERIGRQYESPLEQKRREARETAANMGDAIENIQIDAVDHLGDSIANATQEYIKLGGVAGDVINSIIADLIKLQIKQAIFGSAGGGLFSMFGLGGGSSLSGVNYGSIASAAGSVKIPGFASGGYTGDGPADQAAGIVHKGEFVVPADAVKRIGVQNLAAMSNARAAASMAGVTAAGAAPRPVAQTVLVQVEANDYFDARVKQGAASVAQPIGMAAAVQARTDAGTDVARQARRRIPGR